MDDDAWKRARDLEGKIAESFSHQLQEFKVFYDAIQDEGRKWLKEWLAQLETLERQLPGDLPLSIRVHADPFVTDAEGEIVYEGHGAIRPRILIKSH